MVLVGIAALVEASINGKAFSWIDALRLGWKNLGRVIGTGILAGLVILFYTLLLIIPGVIRMVKYAFCANVVALRNKGWTEALEYSENLVKGNGWEVFGFQFLIIATQIVISVVFLGLFRSNPISAASLPGIILPTFAAILYAFLKVIVTVFFLILDYTKKPPCLGQVFRHGYRNWKKFPE
jgi:hypothetical protein